MLYGASGRASSFAGGRKLEDASVLPSFTVSLTGRDSDGPLPMGAQWAVQKTEHPQGPQPFLGPGSLRPPPLFLYLGKF